MRRIVVLTLGAAMLFFLPARALAQGLTWSVPGDFSTIQLAVDGVSDGDTILVGPGTFAGALVDKSVEIKGVGGATIDSGPVHGSGLIQGFRLLAGSAGATISHLTFTADVDLGSVPSLVEIENGVTSC